MIQLFNPVTNKQSSILLGFVIRWKRIINKQDLIEKCWSIRKADYYIKVLLEKSLLITIGRWKYLIRKDENDVFCIIKHFCWEEWYIWWTRIANAYFWYTQLEQKFVIFNSKISWDKTFGNIRILFIKTILSWKKIISEKWIYYPTKEQAFIDFISFPSFIGWDYELLLTVLKERRINTQKLLQIAKEQKNNANIIRILFMFHKVWIPFDKKDIVKYRANRYINFNVCWLNYWYKNSVFRLIY